tara:strand:- start:5051 stop:5782 length:732 start_codon:yes stop_codon:yes gene_type:complete
MCYATSLTKSETEIQEKFNRNFAIPFVYQKHYHINGFNKNQYLHIIPQGRASIYPSDWGLIPNSSIEDIEAFSSKYRTLNARSETIFTSITYRESAMYQRCLIIADGFFEPHHYKEQPQPYYCQLEGHQLFAFAGLCTNLDDELYSASIITVSANDQFEKIHNKKKRMPLVLDDQFLGNWIEEGLSQNQIKELMNIGFTKTPFITYPVSNNIYKKNIESDIESILDPVTPIDPELGGFKDTLF